MKAGVLGGEVFFSIAFFFCMNCIVLCLSSLELGCFLRSLS